MKKIIAALASIMITASSAYGQGAVVFNNRVGTTVDAPVLGAGAGFSAQLYLVEAGGALLPLTPATTFRTTSPAAFPYVNSVNVEIPGKAPGTSATLRMVAFETAAGSYEAAAASTTFAFGQSMDFTVVLGGGDLPPTNLIGLTGFVVPEPSTLALGFFGAAALLFRHRKSK